MKRTFLCLLLLALLLSGCGRSRKPASLQADVTIPDDGIIRASTFQTMLDENHVARFVGQSNGMEYVWTIFGSDIPEAKDRNLAVDLSLSGQTLSVRCHELGFSPLLSVRTGQDWDCAAASDGSETGITFDENGAVLSFCPRSTDLTLTLGHNSGSRQPGGAAASGQGSVTVSITCYALLNHLEDLTDGKLDQVPHDGVILPTQTATFSEGESAFDVLERACREHKIHMESSMTPIYNSAYIEGIHNLYEFDCGAGSGWNYTVNGWNPGYGCSRYTLEDGDVLRWQYTCNLGADLGNNVNAD